MLEKNTYLGNGGAGMQGSGPGTAAAMIKELQGFNVSLVAGGSAGTKRDLAAIRMEDTVVTALNNNGGTITDITGTISITDVRASGTITLAAVTAGQTVTVNGVTYTAVAGAPQSNRQFSTDVGNNEAAASLAAAITDYEGHKSNTVTATSALAVVTVRAVAEGTGPNAYTLTKVGAGITVSGSGTFAGGTVTGGIHSTGATNQIILFWFNKNA